MGNAAYTEKYKKRFEECSQLFNSAYRKGNGVQSLSNGYTIQVIEYGGKVGKWNLWGSECRLEDSSGKLVLEWRSIDNVGDFYSSIKHSNGKVYLIFRQDLYGYSVFDFDTSELMQFFPESSLGGEETFIWTSINYNPATNVLAVSGCYWAAPYSIQLFTFENPMSEQQKYIDLRECFGCNYSFFRDIDFEKWENGDLHIKRKANETETIESMTIKQDEYLSWLNDKGRLL